MVRHAIIQSKNCSREEQILKMADVIIEALTGDNIDAMDAEVLLDIIVELNAKEAMFLRRMYEKLSCGKKSNGIDIRVFDFKSYDIEETMEIPALVNRLRAKGIFQDIRNPEDRDFWVNGFANILSEYGVLLGRIVYGYDNL